MRAVALIHLNPHPDPLPMGEGNRLDQVQALKYQCGQKETGWLPVVEKRTRQEYYGGGYERAIQFPFGVCRNSTGDPGTDKLFTGQRLDGTGLYFYNTRYNDPVIGRFISADFYFTRF